MAETRRAKATRKDQHDIYKDQVHSITLMKKKQKITTDIQMILKTIKFVTDYHVTLINET